MAGHLVLYALAGLFLCNAIPHAAAGLRGEAFPTPFARPPGRGLSSPMLNVAWSAANLLVGVMLPLAAMELGFSWAPVVVIGSGLAGGLWLARRFARR